MFSVNANSNSITYSSTVSKYISFVYLLQGNQILGNLSPDEYSRVIKVLEDAILSTDLAVYFRYRLM